MYIPALALALLIGGAVGPPLAAEADVKELAS
jgi:hypothetical protein